MNFLAHAYLAGEDEGLIIGNFIADSIKGSSWKQYSLEVQKGILLHRKIDEFTDGHPQVLIGKRRLYQNFSKYSGVISDIFLDHFLAVNFFKYSNKSLEHFVNDFYKTINTNRHLLNEYGNQVSYYMQKNNWLLNYSSISGIENTLLALTKRSKAKCNLNLAISELQTHYVSFENEFFIFFEEMISFVAHQREILEKHGI
jgi:acyl carrier protein phosphodiesterase